MNKWKVIAPLALTAAGAVAAALATLANKPGQGKVPAAASAPAAAKAAPQNLVAGVYSFISGYQDAATVELTLRFDPACSSFAVVAEDFFVYSSASHVALFEGEDFRAQIEYQPYYAGEDFDALVEELGQDPGMKNEPDKSRGYLVCEGLTLYETPFQEAAMALEKVGDISSELVKTNYGYHVLQYAGDIASGEQELTEEIKTSISDDLLKNKQDAAYEAAVTKWVSEADVKTFPKIMK